MLPLNQLSRRLRPGEREKYLLSQEEKAAREAIVNNETDRSLGDLLRSRATYHNSSYFIRIGGKRPN